MWWTISLIRYTKFHIPLLGKLLESLMMAKEAGHIPGIIGRLGDLGEL